LQNLILILDDEASDQSVLTRGLRKLGVQNPILCLEEGRDAIRYFQGEPPYDDRTKFPLPSILFLDLKLPAITGWDVLDWIKGLQMKKECEIFIYSVISSVDDVKRVYSLGADSFIKKPVREVDLINLLHHFPKFWKIKSPRPADAPLANANGGPELEAPGKS
jgi:CheY-like chemotaxis protein